MTDDAHRLIHACYDGVDAAATLLDAEPGLVSARTGLGETALHFLVFENEIDSVRWLFERGATVDTLSELLMSPLADACDLGHEEMVDWLLANGATVDLPDQCMPTLTAAVSGGNAAIVARILAMGADVAVAIRRGGTAMHFACANDRHLAAIELLLAAGAGLDDKRDSGETPLDVAIKAGAHRIADLLRARGATSNVQPV